MLATSQAPSTGAGAAAAASATFLLETVVCDVHWTALQIGTLAMLLARARTGEKNGLQSGRHLIHDDSKTMLLALRYAKEIGLGADIVARLNKTYRDVGDAKQKLAPVLEASRSGRATQGLVQGHSEAWRRIAGEAAATIMQLQQATGSRLSAPYAADSGALRQFLEKAARGSTEAIDAAGVITTPKLQQRRQAPRLAISRTCTLMLPTGPVPARLEDVSLRGLGVVCDAPLTDRQKVTVVLEDGRQLEAVVARRRGPNIGLQLLSSLSTTDPLLNPSRGAGRR